MTRRSLPPLPLVVAIAAAAVATGCNYDPETRLFRQVAPKPADVALAPPGAEAQASEDGNTVTQGLEHCEEDSLRCHAQNIAGGLNRLTFGLLTVVDNVVQLPPSHRETGRRVWGPHFSREDGNTFRFEMARDDDGGFEWCIHVGAGDLTAAGAMREPSCATAATDDGMVLVLSGFLLPGAVSGEAARSGSGSMILEGPRFRDIDPAAEEVGVVTFVYDNTDGQAVRIEVGDTPERGGVFGNAVEYEYTRTPDGAGTFIFAARANFVGDGGFGFEPVLEDFVITSQWRADLAGRADATVSGGDLTEGESYEAIQCWDTALGDVFTFNEHANETTGVEADCAFAEALPRD